MYLLNALLEEQWQVIYALTVADWDFGNPDAVTLHSEAIDHEFECSPVSGKVKVCNGDYGETKWRGIINEAVLDKNGFITASAAKMDEFYLEHDETGARQYTLCHELGHALGLPHTDEDFENEDLGNCMDYTNNYDANKHPDDTNYEYLVDLYGATRGRQRQRFLRKTPDSSVSTPQSFPERPRSKLSEAVSKLERRLDDAAHEDGRRLLHQTEHGEARELELGEGYKVRVHMLLA